MSRRTFNKKLRVEQLEAKTLLAGDVTVVVDDGHLIITGDIDPNDVEVLQGSTADEFIVTETGGGTINTGPGNSITVQGVTKDVRIDLGDEIDTFSTFAATFPRDLIIKLGSGDDRVSFGFGGDLSGSIPNTVVDDVVCIAGDGNDQVFFVDIVFGGDFIFDGGAGDDLLSKLDDSDDIPPSNIGDDLLAWGGSGNDTFNLGATITGTQAAAWTVGDDVTVFGGDDVDALQARDFDIGDDFSFIGGGGDDFFVIEPPTSFGIISNVGDDLLVETGHGNDEVGVESVTIGDDLVVSTGSDDDVVSIANITTIGGGTLVSLGSGSNVLEMEAVDAGHSLTILGGGTNEIALAEVSASCLIKIITSHGDDIIVLEAVSAETAIVSTDGGVDEVAILDSAFELLFVSLGSGDDTLELDGVTADFALISGGLGDDTLVEGTNNIEFQWEFSISV